MTHISESLRSTLDDLKPTSMPTLEVVVNFHPSALLDQLASAYWGELIRVAGFSGTQLLEGIEPLDIRQYLSTLTWMRCCNSVNSSDDKLYKKYRRLARFLAVPTLYYNVLIGIGIAVDNDYAIRFVPGTTAREADTLSPEQMQKISDLFFNLQNSGFRVVAGIPKDPSGELDFMAMAHVEETVLSYRRTHPVYGFLASFFSAKEVEQSLGALVRIRYGYDSDYRVLIGGLVASGGGD